MEYFMIINKSFENKIASNSAGNELDFLLHLSFDHCCDTNIRTIQMQTTCQVLIRHVTQKEILNKNC